MKHLSSFHFPLIELESDVVLIMIPASGKCDEGYFKCTGVDTCIKSVFVCDGTVHCKGIGDDETHCEGMNMCKQLT